MKKNGNSSSLNIKKIGIPIGPLIHKNIDFLKHFNSKARALQTQRRMLQGATNAQLLCFVEICLNILRGKLPVRRKSHLRKLYTIKHWLRGLARTKCAKSARKILLSASPPQVGSGVPAIAGLLASILVPILVEKMKIINK